MTSSLGVSDSWAEQRRPWRSPGRVHVPSFPQWLWFYSSLTCMLPPHPPLLLSSTVSQLQNGVKVWMQTGAVLEQWESPPADMRPQPQNTWDLLLRYPSWTRAVIITFLPYRHVFYFERENFKCRSRVLPISTVNSGKTLGLCLSSAWSTHPYSTTVMVRRYMSVS